VKGDVQQRGIDPKIAVVLDEPEVAELVHEEVDARTRRPHHLRQGFLRNLRKALFRSALIAEPGEQQRTRQQELADRNAASEKARTANKAAWRP
jgi:hypothetical protein